jgi:hypothetical protein
MVQTRTERITMSHSQQRDSVNQTEDLQGRSTARAAKQRITLSLPIAIAKKLKDTATRSQRTYLEVILGGYVEHAASIQHRATEASSQFEGLRPIRRRWPQGRVQVALLIHPGDLRILDDGAAGARLDRSGYISEVIALL